MMPPPSASWGSPRISSAGLYCSNIHFKNSLSVRPFRYVQVAAQEGHFLRDNESTREVKRVEVQVRATRGNLFNFLAKCLGGRTPGRAEQPSPSTERSWFGGECVSSAGESLLNMLFKPIESENPDSSEPSALTVQWFRDAMTLRLCDEFPM